LCFLPLEPMPAPVEEKIEPFLDEDEQPCVSVFTDMTTHGQFRGGWLVATDRRLIAVTPAREEIDGRRVTHLLGPSPTSSRRLPAT